MRALLFKVACLGTLVLLSACGGGAGLRGPIADNMALSRDQRVLARQFEKKDDLPRALFTWKVVAALVPEDKQAAAEVKRLGKLIEERAAWHYKNGMTFWKRGEFDRAEQELLMVLRYDPGFHDALLRLRQYEAYFEHTVVPDDTMQSVAQKYYKDPDKDFLIAFFNGLPDSKSPLRPGAVLKFPVLPFDEPVTSTKDFSEILAQGHESFRAARYEEAVRIAQDVVNQDYANREAAELLKLSSLELSRVFIEQEKFDAAETVLDNIDGNFPELQDARQQVTTRRHEAAEAHYRRGVKFYVNEQLSDAIVEWQQALQILPDHKQAAENIKKTQGILEKLKAVP